MFETVYCSHCNRILVGANGRWWPHIPLGWWARALLKGASDDE